MPGAGAGVAEIKAVREARARPVLARIEQRLRELAGRTPPQGLLGKAVAYGLGQWARIEGYLERMFRIYSDVEPGVTC